MRFAVLFAALVRLSGAARKFGADDETLPIRYSQKDARSYMQLPIKNHIMLFADDDAPHTIKHYQQFVDAVETAANVDRLVPFFVPKTEAGPAAYFDLTAADFPCVVIYNNDADALYRMEKPDSQGRREDLLPITARNIKQFADRFFDGDVNLHIKSEPVPPAGEKDKLVQKYVARNFGQRIQAGNSTLVMFWRTTCPYSEKFAPIYEQFAQMIKRAPSAHLEVAKVNADLNDVRWTNFRLERFPTVYLFRQGDWQTPIDWQDYATERGWGRDLISLIRFVDAHLGEHHGFKLLEEDDPRYAEELQRDNEEELRLKKAKREL